MKKRIFAFALTGLMLLSACSSTDTSSSTDYAITTEGATAETGGFVVADSRASFDEGINFQEHNTEEYNSYDENDFLSVILNPLSTFAADVDTASYANIRRMISNSEIPDVGAVRIEEMINYFSYDYDKPQEGEPFAINTEMTKTPWNEDSYLLRIGVQAEEMPNQNLVFLLDVSGSMNSSDKLGLMKNAFTLLVENLTENDKISIVTYAGTDEVLIDGMDGGNKAEILTAIELLSAGGSTAGSDGIITAYKIAEKHFIEDGNNRVILATDGDLNIGITSESELEDLIDDKKETGVFLSVLGFGTGNIKDNKMQTLAENGNGNYSYIDNIAEARKVLIDEMGSTLFTVAKDVKIQLEFHPDNVNSYRLIGYESRIMDAEDFSDDTKDGGELGSGHQMTALYEIVLPDSPMAIKTDLKYQENVITTDSEELLTISIRYKEPDEDESKLLSYTVKPSLISEEMSDDMKFTSAISEVGMLLIDSSYKGSSSYDSAIGLLEEIDNLGDDDLKDEFLYLTKKLSKLS